MTREWFDALLTSMLDSGVDAPDFLFVAGKSPIGQAHGVLHEFAIDGRDGLTNEEILSLAEIIMSGSERLRHDLATRGSCDCSYSLAGGGGFRVNIYKQRGTHSMVMRRLPAEIPTIESLGLPEVFRALLTEKNGIVFVTGGTASGKTTTLAALLNELNSTQEVHVVTLEDPIEYVHQHKRCIFSQRELGKDFASFSDGLRAALRQAPKVILVGEIRDRETMEIALTAAETGHLVFATLHTISAGQTINRILGLFPREDEQQVRQRLADTVRFIISQRLVNKVDSGRLLVTEVMGSSLRTREALLYGESEGRTFNDIIEAGSARGWHSFDQQLLRSFQENLISEDTAMIFSTNNNRVRREIEFINKSRGKEEASDELSGLKLQSGRGHKAAARAPGGAVAPTPAAAMPGRVTQPAQPRTA
jgi:twitching motility protein PilT